MQTEKAPHITECKNCGKTFDGKFCSNCGQAADTGRINRHYFLHALQHKFIKVDSGFFFTIKELFVRPGKTISDYIAGKRVEYLKPIDLVFLLAGMYGYLFHYYHMDVAAKENGLEEPIRTVVDIINWLMAHFSIAEILLMPFLAASSFIVFYKRRYNYLEHLVIAMFIAAQRLVVSLVFFPLAYAYKNTGTEHTITLLVILTGMILHIFTFVQLFSNRPKMGTALKAVIAYLLSITLYFVVIFIAGMLIGNLQR